MSQLQDEQGSSEGSDEPSSNMAIALLALHHLGGATRFQDTEDIADRCYRLAPHRFRWKKYDYPSLDRVKQALADGRRPRKGSLISGGPKEG